VGEEAVNADQLKKNIGQDLRLRPEALIVEYVPLITGVRTSSGDPVTERRLAKTDYLWRLVSVNGGVKLHCHHTNHNVTLGADNVREFRTPDFLILKCQLTLDGNAVHIEPLWERGGRVGAKNVARAYVVLRSGSVELQHAINVRSVNVAHFDSHRPSVHVAWDRPFVDAFYDVNIGSVEYILGGPVSSNIVPHTKTAEGVVLEFVDSIGMRVLPSGFHIEASGE
jgi:hypothetical protein